MSFTAFGIPVSVSAATLIIILLFLLNGAFYIRSFCKGEPTWKYILMGLLVSCLIFSSVALHEISHGIVARMFNIPIVAAGSTWWGAYVVPGVDPATVSPAANILISLAGPTTNLLIGLVTYLIVRAFPDSLGETSVQFISRVNFRLALFNMLPIPGLDGWTVIQGLVRLAFGPSIIPVIIIGIIISVGLFYADAKVAGLVEKA